MIDSVAKIFLSLAFSFTVGMAITPVVANYLYKHKMWKKRARNEALGGGGTPIFNSLHKDREVNVPRMGGVIIWISAIVTTFVFWSISMLFPVQDTIKLNFLSQNQTWLPLFTLVAASILGLVDDLLQVSERGGYVAGGLSLWKRITVVLLIGAVGAIWFYSKLEVSSINIPFYGYLELGWLFVPFFMLVTLALFSGGVVDGIDGLSGGIMASIFAAYTVIAFAQNQIDLAAFCATLVGGILAFLWFNIPPARFYMTETGILGLTVTLSVVAFLTNEVVVLAIIALPLFVESGSVIIQLLSKKLRGKKVFLVAPLHHHFEAIGWPAYKVTMRFWIISIVLAVIGMTIAIIDINMVG